MKIQDLRIGNYVMGDYDEIPEMLKVEGLKTFDWETDDDCVRFESYNDLWFNIKNISPIPLDENILLKCGFEYVVELLGFGNNKHFIFETNDGYLFCPFCTNDVSCQINVEFLHQLQNVIHVLEKSELEITL